VSSKQFDRYSKVLILLFATQTQSDKAALKQQICMLILDLKKLHRVDKLRHKMIRDRVLDVRQKVDQKHLQFQNLMYESNHLQKEINKCSEFKSKMDDIDLIPREVLLQQCDDEKQKLELAQNDHECVRARLKLEYTERKRYCFRRFNLIANV
jgi:hypothetical protein